MLLGNDCGSILVNCKRLIKKPIPFGNAIKLFVFSFFVVTFVFIGASDAQQPGRPPIQKPYNGPDPVNEFPPMGVSTGGPQLKINGNPVSPLAGETQDLTLTLCTGTKTWKLLKEFTPWDDVNRFGFYTDLGVGVNQTLVFSGPNSQGFTTTTTTSGTVGVWLLNDVDGNLVYNSGDSYLFSQRSLTVGSMANEHQWFMVYDVSAFKGTGATYFFDTDTEDFTTTGDYDYLFYIDDDHTGSNFDHNDMILGMTCPVNPCQNDNTPPQFTNCPSDATFQCNAVPAAPTNLTGTDNCDTSPTITYLGQTTSPGGCPQSYTITRKWKIEDDAGNADTCIQVITVVDTSKPTFTNCPSNTTVQCNAVPSPASPTATDNCDASVAVTYLGQTTTPGACTHAYTLTRKWRAVDDCGNADTCTQVITVVDTSKPTFTNCPASVTVQCNAVPAPASPNATDNCDASVTVTYLGQTTTPGACPQSYTLTRKWEARDDCNNADTCTQVITVQDTTKPTSTNCPANVTVQCNAIPAPASPTATDNCDLTPTIVYLGEVNTPGSCADSYTLTRRWTATDDCGNVDTCTQVITVVDTTKPTFTNCPTNTTVQCDAVPTPANPTATDNCDASVTVTYLGQTTAPGACPQSYTLTRKWQAVDNCGNADTCTQVITVQDTTEPTFVNCPGNITVQCNNVPSPASPTATDNCDASVTVTYLGETTAPNGCPQSYTLTRKWEASDDCNNTDTCTQVITVQDTTSPTFTNCPSNITVQCNAVPSPANPTAADNCDPNPVETYLGETTTPGNCPQSYTLTRKWIAADACGNKSDTCRQVITVIDNIKPVVTNCPSNVTVQCNAIPNPATVTATDQCDPNPTEVYLGETINPGNCPYTITRRWVAVDACGNVSDTCVQTITVIDNVKPVITNCPANATVQCNAVPNPAAVNATDNCDTNPVVTYLGQTSIPGNCPQSYTLVRKWVAHDDCVNASDTCTQTIIVVDTSKPAFTNCPANVTVQCNAVPPVANPTATDNCDASVTVTYLGQTSSPNGCPQNYTLTRKWEARDDCNNTDTCTQVITVQDTIDPIFTNCPPHASAQCNSVPPPANPTATDNCDATPTVTYLGETNTPGSCPSQYTLTRKWEARDDCNNADTCTQVITVGDSTTLSLGADSTKNFGAVCLPTSGTFKLRNATSCSPLTWKVNNVTANQDTTIAYSAGYCTNFNQTWTISVADGCGRSDSYTVTISADVNCLLSATCPALIPDKPVCLLGVPVCIPGVGFNCSDDDGGVTTTLNGQPYNTGDPICFTPNAFGPYALTLICNDGCAADTCTSTVNIVQGPCSEGCAAVSIQKTHNTIQGQYESVAITIDSLPYGIGGFDLLIQYDASALGLSQVEPGSFISGCGWEYFTYRNGASGNCGSNACPSGIVRIIAIGEVNNGPNHPDCFQMEPAHLANLIFLVTNDRTFECQYVPVRFIWYDCGDNTFSSVSGDSLYISDQVFDYFDNNSYTDITDLGASFPGWFGANATCDIDPGNGKPAPIRCIDFFNGGIDIVCADSIDDRGDINMNGLSNEVSDAVLLGNYFIYGIGVFTVNIQGQIAASDVNADGTVLSVADLVYLIRVVVGDAQPYSKAAVPVNVKFTRSEDGRLSVENRTPIGAALVIALGQVQPTLLADGMEVIHNFDGTNTRILVWSINGNSFTGDFLQINGEVTSIEMATAEGNPVALNVVPTEFSLHQNYPNPFNPKTVISFTLPTASDYKLAIYNVNGQEVASFTGSVENAGTIEVEWEAANYASGIYFYRLVAGPHSQIKKMILLK